MGRCNSLVKTKIKNLCNNKILTVSFRSGEKFNEPNFIEKEAKFLYYSKDFFFFLDIADYSEFGINKESINDKKDFLYEGIIVKVLFLNDSVLNIIIPEFLILEVIESENAVKGNTVNNFNKIVKLSTGCLCLVPNFINKGDRIKINTLDRTYIGRE